jgi:hypothetical protein
MSHRKQPRFDWDVRDDATMEQVWRETPRGDTMLRFLETLVAGRALDRGVLVIAVCAAAATVLRYVPQGEERPRRAVDTARAAARGEASDAAVIEAADAAHACYCGFVNSPERDRFVAQAEAAYAAHVAGRIAQDPARQRDWTPALAVYVANAHAHAKLGGGASPEETMGAHGKSHAIVARAIRAAVPWRDVANAVERAEAIDEH